MTGPLAVQEYIQELISLFVFTQETTQAIFRKLFKNHSKQIWKYEHIRQFVLELNLLATSLKDICSKDSCPTMKGSSDSEFLCAAHKTPIYCTAIDYMVHNLDQATSILLNIKNFNSRVSISDTKSLDTIVRRLYRLFSHTYHFHKEMFQLFEKDMHLCERFTEFSLKHGLI